MDPRWLMMTLADALPKDAVVVEEGLTSTFSLQSFLRFRDAQGFYGLASGGIGFAMAGAVGISVALPDRPVVAIVGDGSAMYSIQALWTAANLKRPITYVICSNTAPSQGRLVSMRAPRNSSAWTCAIPRSTSSPCRIAGRTGKAISAARTWSGAARGNATVARPS
jgi:thiamine pyrophosphate-dependent acetolactate synthase large subunit-like protein